jgi:ATP-dependent 26S proteasome regulatory subunit
MATADVLVVSVQVVKQEIRVVEREQNTLKEYIKDNEEKIKMNKVLPYLVSNVVEVCVCVCVCVCDGVCLCVCVCGLIML